LFLKFDNKVLFSKSRKISKKIPMTNSIKFSNLSPSPVSSKLSKKELSKSKYYRKNQKNLKTNLTKRKDILMLKCHLVVLRKFLN